MRSIPLRGATINATSYCFVGVYTLCAGWGVGVGVGVGGERSNPLEGGATIYAISLLLFTGCDDDWVGISSRGVGVVRWESEPSYVLQRSQKEKEKGVESSRRIVYIRETNQNQGPSREWDRERGKKPAETESRREMEINRAVGRWVRLHLNKPKPRSRENRVLDKWKDFGSIVGDYYRSRCCCHYLEESSSWSWNPLNWKLQRVLIRYLFWSSVWYLSKHNLEPGVQ